MDHSEHYEEVNLMESLAVLWKRKWFIVIATAILVIVAGIATFLITPVWEVDAIVQPSKYFIQNQQGQFEEVLATDPTQVAGQINHAAYNDIVAAELNLDKMRLPKIRAEHLRDTNLVRISVKDKDINKGKKILSSLFSYIKSDFDRKIEVEIRDSDSQIATNENEIKQKELTINDKVSEIKLLHIRKEKMKQEILSEKNKLKISEDRSRTISEEIKSVKTRIGNLEVGLKKALEEKKEGKGTDAVALLLYSNEVQNNLRYYNTLDEELSREKIRQEDIRLDMKGKIEDLKQTDTEIEKIKNAIEKVKNDMDNSQKKIELLKVKKSRVDYAKLIKAPMPSLRPVFPRRGQFMLIAGFIGLIFFAVLAFFMENLERQKKPKA